MACGPAGLVVGSGLANACKIFQAGGSKKIFDELLSVLFFSFC
jgi:hypothetical protein